MSRVVWRIATDTPKYVAEDLTGAGAKATGGRWNEPGVPMIYAAETRALACLETVVHLNSGGLPLNRYLVAINIPDDVWSRAETALPSTLVGWDAEPAGRVSIAFGTSWLRSNSAAVMFVPSVIVPEEQNVLINPDHPQAKAITATKIRKWLYDPRLDRRLIHAKTAKAK